MNVVYLSMYTAETVSLDVFADDYARYAAFCRLYRVSEMDGLSVLLNLAGEGSVEDLEREALDRPDFVFDNSEELSAADVSVLEERAADGEIWSLLNLASAYVDGRLSWNPREAYRLASVAADTGHPEALYLAGTSAYLCAMYDEAFLLFERGADLKHAECEFLLGLCYVLGHGCEADEETGAILMTRASKKGAGIVEKAGMVLGKRFGNGDAEE